MNTWLCSKLHCNVGHAWVRIPEFSHFYRSLLPRHLKRTSHLAVSFLLSNFVIRNLKNNFKKTPIILLDLFSLLRVYSKTQKSIREYLFFHFVENRNLPCNSLQKLERKINDRFDKNNATFFWAGHLAPSNLLSQESLGNQTNCPEACTVLWLPVTQSLRETLNSIALGRLFLGIPISGLAQREHSCDHSHLDLPHRSDSENRRAAASSF